MKACPFCGSRGVWAEAGDPYHYVICSSCGCSGPEKASRVLAITAWNGRSQPAAPSDMGPASPGDEPTIAEQVPLWDAINAWAAGNAIAKGKAVPQVHAIIAGIVRARRATPAPDMEEARRLLEALVRDWDIAVNAKIDDDMYRRFGLAQRNIEMVRAYLARTTPPAQPQEGGAG